MGPRIVSALQAAFIILASSEALAQEQAPQYQAKQYYAAESSSKPATTATSSKVIEQSTDNAHKHRLQGQVTREDFRLPRKPLFGDPRAFTDAPPPSQTGAAQAAAPVAGQVSENARPRGTYLWVQSREGGYYDATGQIQAIIPGDQLYKYGGKLQDGSEVPPYPVVTNFAGHVYKPFVKKMAQ